MRRRAPSDFDAPGSSHRVPTTVPGDQVSPAVPVHVTGTDHPVVAGQVGPGRAHERHEGPVGAGEPRPGVERLPGARADQVERAHGGRRGARCEEPGLAVARVDRHLPLGSLAGQVRVAVARDVTHRGEAGHGPPALAEDHGTHEGPVAQAAVQHEDVPSGLAGDHVAPAVAVPVAHTEHLGGRRDDQVAHLRWKEVREPVVGEHDELRAGLVHPDQVGLAGPAHLASREPVHGGEGGRLRHGRPESPSTRSRDDGHLTRPARPGHDVRDGVPREIRCSTDDGVVGLAHGAQLDGCAEHAPAGRRARGRGSRCGGWRPRRVDRHR